MTAAPDAMHITAVRDRVRERLVGREHELDLVLAAVAAGRDIVLEGPPGTSKSTLLRGITAEWGIPLVFVEGNADLTPAKLVGHHNPARVLREDYSAENFVDGPLLEAMRSGGFLYIEEFNRAPEDTVNTLLTAMAERQIAVPRADTVVAKPTFRVIASMNPYDNVGTTRLSTSVHDARGGAGGLVLPGDNRRPPGRAPKRPGRGAPGMTTEQGMLPPVPAGDPAKGAL